MDAYPPDYVARNYPLIFLSGLRQPTEESESRTGLTNGPLVEGHRPLVTDERKDLLLQGFLSLQGNASAPVSKSKIGSAGYRFRVVGRSYVFPRKKADPPSPVDIQRGNPLEEEPTSPARWMLHSPLSPLSPSSTLYPDGLLSPDWMNKHQHQVPAVIIAFYDFASDPNLNSLNDNQLKSEITSLKKALADSDYRTRLSIVLLGDKAVPESPETEERINTIRKMTNLDAKTGLFYLSPKAANSEIAKFAASTMASILPACLDYYRELTKHTRRKKNRSSVPDPTIPSNKATSNPLSTVAWNIRYDVKLGVFSEIRQEMEGACRHYTSALEALMGSEGVFETTPSWSPRWNEGRMLADVMALRIIRCLLWSQLTTTATQSWVNYRDRIRELVDRRGKGSSNYGWEAWESRWAKVMAELIQRADIPGMKITDSVDMTASTILSKPDSAVYMPPEKSLGLDRLYPWHHLHHPGYWMRLSARSAKRRRRYAMEIPEEDRTPPGMSPASTMAKRSGTYDTYLCPEPHEESNASGDGFDHCADIVERLQLSAKIFSEKGQSRFAERIKLELGRELLRKGDYQDAVRLLKALWDDCSWRREKWWIPLYELNRALAEGSRACGNIAALVSTVFEMHSPHLRLRRDTRLDLMACSRGLTVEESQPIKITLSPGSVTAFLATSFSFASDEGNVGDPIKGQLVMTSEAHEATAPITFSTIKGLFKQGRYSFEIKHSPQDANQPQQIISLADESSVSTEDGKQVFHYSADLKFPAGRQAVWELSFDVKDPGSLELEAVEMEIETDTYSVIYFVRTLHFQLPCLWYIPTKEGYWHKRMSRETPWIVEVKPKPPKVKLSILNIDQGIYTDEPVELTFQFTNEEEEEVSVAVDARLLSRQGAPELSWQLTDGPEATKPSSRALELPNLAPTHSSSQTATFTAPPTPGKLILEAKLHYFLPSDPAIPLTKTFTETLAVTSPFEANYDFRPCTHPAPWPSYFSADAPAPGLLQRWRLDVRMASFAAAPLAVHAVAVAPTRIPPGLASCVVVDAEEEQRQSEMAPRTMRALPFTLDTVRRPAKEHRAAALEAAVTVAWSRVRRGAASGSGRAPPAVVSSTLAVPPLVVPALEPRVVADAVHGRAPGGGKDPSSTAAPAEGEGDVGAGGVPLTTLTLVMENPTAHPLTFDVAAPSGERLAFAGPKQAAVALLPYSRGEVVYRLVPLRGKDGGDDAEGDKRVVFGVRVQDRYFVREVEVLAGEGLEAHEGGVSWVVE